MKIKIDYGKKGLEINVPEKNIIKIFEMPKVKPLENPQEVLKEKLKNPIGRNSLKNIARNKNTCCIVVSDKTRPVPNKIILPPILEILDELKIKTKILIATGMHSPTIGDDLEYLLGKEIIKNYEIINHNPYDKSKLVKIDEIDGVEVYINKFYWESELKILTGFIEPHFMAGFSGGRKSICPGIIGIDTIKYFHSPLLLESPYAAVGNLEKNPCHEFALKVAKKSKVDFIVNVTLNSKKEITGIFCGELEKAHLEGVKFCSKCTTVYAEEKADIVITSNGGYPLDRDFYQTVKGLVSSLEVIKDGGTIIIASECIDGIGSKDFKELLFNMKDIDEFIDMIKDKNFFRVDQWEVEELVKVLRKAKIKIYSENLSDEEIRKCWAEPVRDIDKEIENEIKKNPNLKISIIPNGPYVIAKIKEKR